MPTKKSTPFTSHPQSPFVSSWAKESIDIPWAINKFRHWLPRWSAPLGFVDDDWFLVTFTVYDDRAGQVWLKEWRHDVPDDAVAPDKKIHFVANSLVEFVSTWYKSAGGGG